jgi:hypothetical protein
MEAKAEHDNLYEVAVLSLVRPLASLLQLKSPAPRECTLLPAVPLPDYIVAVILLCGIVFDELVFPAS